MSLLVSKILPLQAICHCDWKPKSYIFSISNFYTNNDAASHFVPSFERQREVVKVSFTTKSDLDHFQVGRWLEIMSRVQPEVLITTT